MCCPEKVKVVPVFDDRAVGHRSDKNTKLKNRLNTICALKPNEVGYIVPDYIFVPETYSFEEPKKPYVMVEIKSPLLICKDKEWFYKDLTYQKNNKKVLNELELESRACEIVIFTDGITWMFLSWNEEKNCLVNASNFKPVSLVEIIQSEKNNPEKYNQRKDCKYTKIKWLKSDDNYNIVVNKIKNIILEKKNAKK